MVAVMVEQKLQLSFEDWIVEVFAQPYTREIWRAPSLVEFCKSTEVVGYTAKLFREPAFLRARYSSDQIGQGIWYVLFNVCVERIRWIAESEDALDPDLEWIDATVPLFQKLFRKVCPSPPPSRAYLKSLPPLSPGQSDHAGEEIDTACYMFWDPLCDSRYPSDVPRVAARQELIDSRCCDALELILYMRRKSCQRAALHGLGHMHDWRPERVESIINGFLKSPRPAGRHIREYARKARAGGIM